MNSLDDDSCVYVWKDEWWLFVGVFQVSFPCSWCKVREFQWVQQKKRHSKARICAMLCHFVCSGWHFWVKFTSLQILFFCFPLSRFGVGFERVGVFDAGDGAHLLIFHNGKTFEGYFRQ